MKIDLAKPDYIHLMGPQCVTIMAIVRCKYMNGYDLKFQEFNFKIPTFHIVTGRIIDCPRYDSFDAMSKKKKSLQYHQGITLIQCGLK